MLIRRSSKNYPKKDETKNTYCKNAKKNYKGTFLIKQKKNYSKPFQTQVIACYNCREVGHKANKCPLKEKIAPIDDKKFQKTMLSLLIHYDSEEVL